MTDTIQPARAAPITDSERTMLQEWSKRAISRGINNVQYFAAYRFNSYEARLSAAEQENTRLREALEEIAAQNDLEGVSNNELCTAARNKLYECELIARNALTKGKNDGA